MIGGYTSFGSGNWDQTLWDGLIPVDMSGANTRGLGYISGNLKIDIPRAAEGQHPIWYIVDDPSAEPADPGPDARVLRVELTDRPAATLLGATSTPQNGIRNMPVFACQAFGKGRTFSMSTDTTVAWGTAVESTWGEGDNRAISSGGIAMASAENSTQRQPSAPGRDRQGPLPSRRADRDHRQGVRRTPGADLEIPPDRSASKASRRRRADAASPASSARPATTMEPRAGTADRPASAR